MRARATWVGVCLLSMLACMGGGACGESVAESAAEPDGPLEALSPWPAQPASCPRARSVAALTREADALWERARFDPADGPRAVLRLRSALQCARVQGDLEAVDRLSVRRDRWMGWVREQLDRERLRLTLALRASEPAAIRRHAQRVAALLIEAEGPGAEEARAYLRRVQRHARVLLAQAEEEGGP